MNVILFILMSFQTNLFVPVSTRAEFRKKYVPFSIQKQLIVIMFLNDSSIFNVGKTIHLKIDSYVFVSNTMPSFDTI